MVNRRLSRRLGRIVTLAAVALVIAPAAAQAFSKAIWGDVYRNGINQFPLYHRMGVKIFEMDLDWFQVAPTRPRNAANPRDHAYAWPAGVQEAITQAKRYHMQVLLQIIGSPAWANGGHSWNWMPRTSAYATFAATAARKYPGVHLWMIW